MASKVWFIAVLLLALVSRARAWRLQGSICSALPRKWLQKTVAATAVAASFSAGCGMVTFDALHPTAAVAAALPVVGKDAPDFTLPSNAGNDISLKVLAGKRTVLYFYPVSCT